MGLSIGIGDLALLLTEDDLDPDEAEDARRSFAELTAFLVAQGLEPHVEPESLPPIPSRGHTEGFPYSALHTLRRAYAYMYAGETLTPLAGQDAIEDPILRRAYDDSTCISHLLVHSDCEGFYVPQEFPEPLVAQRDGVVLGDIVGSTQRLLRELLEVAPVIGIRLTDGTLSDEHAALLAEEQGHDYATERMVWFALFECCIASLKYGSAIRFG